jgi:CheY-like chemotaxis protein
MKDEFLGVVSHELRTPLNAILGWAHILTSAQAVDPAKTARGLEVILRNAESQHRLVEDLLDVSRIVTGKLSIDVHGPSHLAVIVRAAMDTMQHVASTRRVTLVLHLRSDPRVMADVERIEQVTRNLLSNAVKFAPQGGKVDVTVDAHDGVAVLSVRDNGCGIEPTEIPRLFERFRQVDGSPSRLHGGLGLGLAIVRHVVELHRGRAWGESEGIGHGATFHVELPLAPGSVGPTIPPPDGQGDFGLLQSLAGLRVLVLEDDDDARMLAAVVLESAGATVVAVGTAAHGLASLVRLAPDVVVSDIGMPGQDGFSFLRQVRALPPPACTVPVVALTAYARPEDVETAKAAGFDDHLAKPTSPFELIEMVGRLARSKR